MGREETFLAAQWLRLCTSTAGAWVWSLVRELRSWMLQLQPKEKDQKKKDLIKKIKFKFKK